MIHWTIRAATLFYVLAIAQMLRHRDARVYWTAGCALYVAHVVAAFQLAYHWSHTVAVRETARQTNALFGFDWGGGIWFNYAFTAIWLADASWWWLSPRSRDSRPYWIGATVHAYMAWMFINGVIVFPAGPVRYLGLALLAAVSVVWRRSRRK